MFEIVVCCKLAPKWLQHHYRQLIVEGVGIEDIVVWLAYKSISYAFDIVVFASFLGIACVRIRLQY